MFTIHRESAEPSLGFSVRGGSEHGLGLYISEIDEGSAAGIKINRVSKKSPNIMNDPCREKTCLLGCGFDQHKIARFLEFLL